MFQGVEPYKGTTLDKVQQIKLSMSCIILVNTMWVAGSMQWWIVMLQTGLRHVFIQ